MIKRLNPIIRGWAAYYRTQVSARIFSALDNYLWQLIYKWAVISHSNQPKLWVIARYFGRFNKARQRPVGVRRPRKRRLPPQVRLDQHHPAPDRQTRSITR